MIRHFPKRDYETVSRSRKPRAAEKSIFEITQKSISRDAQVAGNTPRESPATAIELGSAFLRPGHLLSFAFLFLFTVILYVRPSELYPSPFTNSIALIVGILTLMFFIPMQLSLEGTLTAPLREVKIVSLFCLTALLSVPLAINPLTAWQEFSGTFIRCILIFIVMVNVTRTEARLKAL